MRKEIELAFIKDFIRKDKQERYRSCLANPKKRKKMLARLDHNPDFEENSVTWLKSNDPLDTYFKGGALKKPVYLISSDANVDGKTMSLQEALNLLQGYPEGTIISIIGEQQAFYWGEDGREQALLRK